MSRPRLLQPLLARRPADRVQQQEFDLRVHAAQLVGRPLLDRLVELRADPQQEALALGHGTGYWYSVPALTTGCARCSPQSTTSRLETIAALRSSSRSTICCSESWFRASCTMPTAPATMRVRAATTASACCLRSMSAAISGA